MTRLHLAALFVVLALLPAPGRLAATELGYACACVGTADRPDCGSAGGAIAGNHGQLNRGIPAGQVQPFYQPGPSGWACLPDAVYACRCAGRPDRPRCGNGGVPAPIGELHIALSLTDVLRNYRPGQVGAEASGWVCLVTDLPDR